MKSGAFPSNNEKKTPETKTHNQPTCDDNGTCKKSGAFSSNNGMRIHEMKTHNQPTYDDNGTCKKNDAFSYNNEKKIHYSSSFLHLHFVIYYSVDQ